MSLWRLLLLTIVILGVNSKRRDGLSSVNQGNNGNLYQKNVSPLHLKPINQRPAANSDINANANLQQKVGNETGNKNCWVTLHAKRHFKVMDAIDAKYANTLAQFDQVWKDQKLDDTMVKVMVAKRAAAERAVFHMGHKSLIPAGIELGGYVMVPMPTTLLFFQRVKLRNQTVFQVRYLDSDLKNMVLISKIALNDLHLRGTYMRAVIDKDPSNIFYKPANGEVGILLKNVMYHIEGRYRYVQDRLTIEHIISDLKISDVIMTYGNGSDICDETSEKISVSMIVTFIAKLKADLDSWVKDYFNDYLLQIDLYPITVNFANQLVKYEEEKLLALNGYVDVALAALKWRLYSLKPRAADVKIPPVTLHSYTGVEIQLTNGVIRGIDTFYRQSVATARKDINGVRKVDAVIGFHRLKVEYQYAAKINGMPTVYGLIVLSADDLAGTLHINLVDEPETADLEINFYRHTRSEKLVISGSLNRLIANFKYILEDQIMSLLINKLWFQIKLLGTLTTCEPLLVGPEPDPKGSDEIVTDDERQPIVVTRNDSIELQLQPQSGEAEDKPRKLHIKYGEEIRIDELKARKGGSGENNEIVDKANKDDAQQQEQQNSRRKNNHRRPKLRRHQ